MENNEIKITLNVEGLHSEIEAVKRLKERLDFYRAIVEIYLPDFIINEN